MEPTPRTITFRDYGVWLVASAAALTLLFAAQQAVRRSAAGASAEWGVALALNGLDWAVWGSLVPLIVAIGQRHRFGGAGNRLRRIVVWVALWAMCVLAVSIVTGLMLHAWPRVFLGVVGGPPGFAAVPLRPYLLAWTTANASFNTLIFGGIAGVLHAALYFRDLRIRRLRQAELESRLTRAELSVLRMQLQPHFFFNALHTVSSLMVTDVPAAQAVIASLGTLLRSSLDHTARQETTLREELAFVGLYVDVQAARFRQRLRVHVDVPEEVQDGLVPSLVLQPLVENAIRHGIEPSRSGGSIWVEAAREGEQLVLRVRDEASDPLLHPPAANGVNGRGGIGLKNIAARLGQLYGSQHHFHAGRDPDGRFSVRLSLPYHTDEALFPQHVVSA